MPFLLFQFPSSEEARPSFGLLCGLFDMAMRGLLAVLAFAVGAAGAPSLSSDALLKEGGAEHPEQK